MQTLVKAKMCPETNECKKAERHIKHKEEAGDFIHAGQTLVCKV